MVFLHYKNYVIRHVGEMILVVNIKDNAVFEIDQIAKAYIEYAQSHNGQISAEYFAKVTNKSFDIIIDEINFLIKTFDGAGEQDNA